MSIQRRPGVYVTFALLMGLGLVALGACGGDKAADSAAAADAAWTALEAEHTALEAKRAELKAAAGAEATPEGQEGQEGQEGEAAPSPAESPVAALQKEVDDATQAFGEHLVAYINDNPPLVGEPMTERQKAAVRMKSDEDIVLAREYIDKGGDYRKAIKIYEAALMVDPEYDRLKQELADAEAKRFMTEERFGQAKKGMTEDEVRDALGQPLLRNVRFFEKENVTAWYYPKDDRGAAAAVWFREDKKKGAKTVYQLQFDAIGDQAGAAESDS